MKPSIGKTVDGKETLDWIDIVVRDVAELPGRTSPDDCPEAMLVTAVELRAILENSAAAEEAESLREELERWRKGYNSITKSHYMEKTLTLERRA